MKHVEGYFTGSGGLNLYRQEWLPASGCRAVVVIVHGVGEHGGNYAAIASALADAGYAVFAYDQRGHGRSPGQRVHVRRWAEYCQDLDAGIRHASARAPAAPVFVYAHSMGTVVVLDYLLSHATASVNGVVLSGTAIEPAGVGSPAMKLLARALSGILPHASARLPIDDSAFTRDFDVLAAYRADPLASTVASARFGAEGEKAVARVRQGLGGLQVPLLVLHGEADNVTLVTGAHVLYDAAASPDKILRIYPGAYHDIHNDLCRDEVASDVLEWLVERTRCTEAAAPYALVSGERS